jgi:hypothetical protein
MVEKEIITLYHNSTFERMEISRGGFKDWNLGEFL